ncbi:M15 family metallopeptidase [Crenobacter sp. SG2305]|uniref:M15 family metallopeptidase n=1 Tax=Crenobacter oryzisoli TaxID=3056844 RepID=UPI0025AA7A29|nr:M15 family metallopeptidase [Crenobacter sp. SG2305]MDN0084542.1 M15 family metallopeptidase [Crenobacter sp. SG2305]
MKPAHIIIPLEALAGHDEYVTIRDIPHVRIDLRYASNNNFIGRDLYGHFDGGFLHRRAATQLAEAARRLQRYKPGWRLLVLDALRPGRVQRQLWAAVEGTPKEIYVANPDRGSIHSFGMAIDLTLEDENGVEQDMGTPFDDFTLLSHPAREKEMLANGKLSAQQHASRLLLRRCMTEAGFATIPTEWWHFDAADKVMIRATFRLVE